MAKNIFLQINSSGCLTSCEHCWAQGKPFKNMPLIDLEEILFKMKEYLSDKPEYALDPFPMFEELAHPETGTQMKLFMKYGMMPYDMPTSGIALAVRPDWKDVLDCIKELEYKFMVLSFHGIGAVHDKAVNRKGAFEDLKLALERIRSAGIDLSFNVFITKESINEIPELIKNVIAPDIDHENIMISFARYNATSRGRRYEKIRTEYSDVEKISSTLAEYCVDGETIPDADSFLSGIRANTEAELVKLALSLSNEERKNYKPRFMDDIWLVADQNFDLYTGKGNFLTIHHGNIKKDNFSNLMKKALSDNPFSALHSCFSKDISDIDISELAEKYGNPKGQKIYQGGLDEIKAYWIDQAFAEYRRY
ncbi:MAG TPA: hypothetical protein PLK90_09200 [Clostridiales bacterium]|nr:hypothetical protein [Clostridiales bacterium]HQP70562.1 hypothetical protein [Clostridiales bacterium]